MAGEGPNEITNMGVIVPDEVHHRFFVPDYGKLKVLSYSVDSILKKSFLST